MPIRQHVLIKEGDNGNPTGTVQQTDVSNTSDPTNGNNDNVCEA